MPKNIRIGIPFAIDVEILPDYEGSVNIEATLGPYSKADTPSFDFKSTATATVASGKFYKAKRSTTLTNLHAFSNR